MKGSKLARRSAKQIFRHCLADGVLDEGRVRLAVQRIGAGTNRNRLAVLTELLRLVKFDKASRTAAVESAAPLQDDLRESVQAGLLKVYGPVLDINFTQNPALLGGMKIKVGSDVYDGSVQAKLAALEARF